MRLILINQALGHPKMRFSGSRPTEFPFVHAPPPPNGAENGFFHLVSPGGHFRYPPPLILGVLSSIISLILINQAPGHPKMRFSGFKPTEFPLAPPPPPKTVPKMGFFTS